MASHSPFGHFVEGWVESGVKSVCLFFQQEFVLRAGFYTSLVSTKTDIVVAGGGERLLGLGLVKRKTVINLNNNLTVVCKVLNRKTKINRRSN